MLNLVKNWYENLFKRIDLCLDFLLLLYVVSREVNDNGIFIKG